MNETKGYYKVFDFRIILNTSDSHVWLYTENESISNIYEDGSKSAVGIRCAFCILTFDY